MSFQSSRQSTSDRSNPFMAIGSPKRTSSGSLQPSAPPIPESFPPLQQGNMYPLLTGLQEAAEQQCRLPDTQNQPSPPIDRPRSDFAIRSAMVEPVSKPRSAYPSLPRSAYPSLSELYGPNDTGQPDLYDAKPPVSLPHYAKPQPFSYTESDRPPPPPLQQPPAYLTEPNIIGDNNPKKASSDPALPAPQAPGPAKRRQWAWKRRGSGGWQERRCTYLCFYAVTGAIFAVGAAGLALGLLAAMDEARLGELVQKGSSGPMMALKLQALVKAATAFLLLGGTAVMLLGFLGCGGVLMRSPLMLALFTLALFLLALAQLCLCSLLVSDCDQVHRGLLTTLRDQLRRRYDGRTDSTDFVSQLMDFVQITFHCCGLKGGEDFLDTPWYKKQRVSNETVPQTCCQMLEPKQHLDGTFTLKLADAHCPFSAPGPENPYTGTPCYNLIREMLAKTEYVIIILVFSTLLIGGETSLIISAVHIIQVMRKKEFMIALQQPAPQARN